MKNLTLNSIGICLMAMILITLQLKAQPQRDQQDMAWIKLHSGHALYLDTNTLEWIPLVDRERIPVKTYLMVNGQSSLTLYHETEIYTIPDSSYIYIEDIMNRNRDELVKMLTLIEAEHLPKQERESSRKQQKIGVTYGNRTGSTKDDRPIRDSIPYIDEQLNAVHWFASQNRPDASLLIFKRLMTRYPDLYRDPEYFNLLCTFYEQLKLWGFLYNDTQKLLRMNPPEEVSGLARAWLNRVEERVQH